MSVFHNIATSSRRVTLWTLPGVKFLVDGVPAPTTNNQQAVSTHIALNQFGVPLFLRCRVECKFFVLRQVRLGGLVYYLTKRAAISSFIFPMQPFTNTPSPYRLDPFICLFRFSVREVLASMHRMVVPATHSLRTIC